MNNAGLIPTCHFTARYRSTESTASFGSNTGNPTSGNYMNFLSARYISIETTLHELGHFMDYDFGAGLSFQDYQYSACGCILGKWMARLSEFWFNFKGARTLCSSTHTFPYTEYSSYPYTAAEGTESPSIQGDIDSANYGCVYKEDLSHPIIDQLNRAAALFNSIKGYDGFVGVANCMYLTPRYSVEDGTYYIKGLQSNQYLADNGGVLAWVDSNSSNTTKWIAQYYPDTCLQTLTNMATGTTIDPTNENGLTSDTAYVQISPTIYDDADGNDTHIIMAGSTSTVDSVRYGLSRTTIKDTGYIANHTYDESSYADAYTPRLPQFSFTFIAI